MTHHNRPDSTYRHTQHLITKGNTMNRITRWRGGVAITAAVAATTLGLAAPAFAATPDSLIDPGHDISLNIVKLSNTPGTQGANNGTELALPSTGVNAARPIEGVGFTAYPITYDADGGGAAPAAPIDLSTTAGWQQAAALAATPAFATSMDGWDGTTTEGDVAADVAAADSDYGVDTAGSLSGTTDSDGQVSWTDDDGLRMSLYLVVETTRPLSVEVATKPFLVTVPMTDPTNTAVAPDPSNAQTTWNYDVYAYPKNVVPQIAKTVADATALVGAGFSNGDDAADGVTAGQSLEYTLSIPVPDTNGSATGNGISTLVVTDDLPDRFVDLTADDISVTAGSALPHSDNGDGDDDGYVVSIGAGNDITITIDGVNGTAATDAVTAINGVSTITVTITATANAAGDPITNTADATFNDGLTTEVDIPSTSATTKYGLVTLTKTDADGTPIDGAVFELYLATDPDADDADADGDADATADFADAHVYEEGGSAVRFTTDADGKIRALLRYNAYQDGDVLADPTPLYWLVEVQATDDHELLAEPIPVTVDGTDIQLTKIDAAANAGFSLPLTGGFGTFVFYAVGGAIVALTIILLVVLGARRRREREQH